MRWALIACRRRREVFRGTMLGCAAFLRTAKIDRFLGLSSRSLAAAFGRVGHVDRSIEAASAIQVKKRWFSGFASRANTRVNFSGVSVPVFSYAKSNRRDLVGSTGLRVSRYRRPSIAVHDQSWAPLAFSLMAKRKESHPTGRSGQTGGPLCRRAWPPPRGRRSGPLSNNAAEIRLAVTDLRG
jgi:hypothetical protein